MSIRSTFVLILTIFSLVLGGCASSTTKDSSDPLQPFNRAMYDFNDGLDHLILKPVAEAYLYVAPQPVVTGVHNFYNNLDNIPTIGNDILQGNFYQATSDTWRFAINTTAGVLGIFDVATLMGLPQNSEDMGLTFAQWGWKKSDYLVLPFFGPSTVRDGLGRIPNSYMTIYPYISNVALRNQLFAMGVVDTRANLLQLRGVIEQAAIDKYVFERNAYLQRRAYLIKRNTELSDPYLHHEDEQKMPPLRTAKAPQQTATYY